MAFRSNDTFSDEMLRAINDYRSHHQAPPLKLNSEISKTSQKWADYMARTDNFRHNDSAIYIGKELGENIAMRWNSDGRQYTGKQIAEMWYNEIENYNFRTHSGPNTGHFTQLVWKDSKELGVGKAIGPGGKFYVVANFHPAGNFLGCYAGNVLPPSDGKVSIAAAQPKPNAVKSPQESQNKPINQSPRFSTSITNRSTPASSFSSGAKEDSIFSRATPAASSTTSTRQVTQSNQLCFPGTSFARPSASSTNPAPFSGSKFTTTSTNQSKDQSVCISRQTRQQTTGYGANATTKTIVIEKFQDPDGSIRTVQKEMVTSGNDQAPSVNSKFGEMEKNFDGWNLNNSTESKHQVITVPLRVGADKNNSSFAGFGSTNSPGSGRKVVTGASSSPSFGHSAAASSSSSSSSSSTSGGQTQNDFIEEVIRSHNNYRRKHGRVGDLKRNRELCDIAQRWAENLARSRTLQHSGNKFQSQPLGENVACKYGSGKIDYTGEEAVGEWYKEVSDYNFVTADKSWGKTTGHFTQVVWKGSQEIGVGKGVSRDGTAVFVVCNYWPAGNMSGRYKENVFPAK